MFLYALMGMLYAADLDYVNISKGEEAPFAGKLLTYEAMTGIIATHESEIAVLTAQKDYQLKKQFDEMTLRYDLYAIKCTANEEMHSQMIDFRDKEIKAQARKDWLQRLSFVGGFLLGTSATIAITYSVNQN